MGMNGIEAREFLIANQKLAYKVLSYCQVSSLPGYDKEDLIQELNLCMFCAIDKFDDSQNTCKLTTYLFNAMVNRVRELVRKARAKKRVEAFCQLSLEATYEEDSNFSLLRTLESSQPSVESMAYSKELFDALTDEIKNLREKYWYPVYLFFFESKSQAEAAKIAQVSQPSLSLQIKKVRDAMVAFNLGSNLELNA